MSQLPRNDNEYTSSKIPSLENEEMEALARREELRGQEYASTVKQLEIGMRDLKTTLEPQMYFVFKF